MKVPEFCKKTPKLVSVKVFSTGPIKLAPSPVVLKKLDVVQSVIQTAEAKVPKFCALSKLDLAENKNRQRSRIRFIK